MGMIHLPACPTLEKALHDGATVIRAPVVPQPRKSMNHPDLVHWQPTDFVNRWFDKSDEQGLADFILAHSPLGKPGDVVGVQGRWVYEGQYEPIEYDPERLRNTVAVATLDPSKPGFPYGDEVRPAHTMPDWAIRLHYRVEAVRVERLSADTTDVYGETPPTPRYRSFDITEALERQYPAWWDSRLTPEGERYGDVYPFDNNPFTVAAEVVREEE